MHSVSEERHHFTPMRVLGLALGPLVFALTLLTTPFEGLSPEAYRTLGLMAWMVLWWLTEAVPLPATALLPIIILPLTGISSLTRALTSYAAESVFLCLGGFVIGVAMEKWHLHHRVAFHVVRMVGTRADRIIAGFMFATALISMWLNNTATVVMMLPIAVSVIHLLLGQHSHMHENLAGRRNFSIAMMLGVAYASSIGGIGTLIGTPTNMLMVGFLERTYEYSVDFIDWMKVATPVALVMTFAGWVLLTKLLFRNHLHDIAGAKEIVAAEISKLGRMSRGEKLVAAVFAMAVFLWATKGMLAEYFPLFAQLEDASVAILAMLMLFLLPVNARKGEFVLSWQDAERIPWSVIILLGGALSLATALQDTGVANWLGDKVAHLDRVNLLLMVLVVTAAIMALTEFMSNIATITAFLPVVVTVAVGVGENPLLFAIPATMAASCAFMLPISTSPNIIVFGSGYVRVAQMARAGILLNVLALGIILAATYLIAVPVFHIEPGLVPDWVNALEN